MDLNALTQGLNTLKDSQSGWQSRVMWAYTAFAVVALTYMGLTSDAGLQWRIFATLGLVTSVYIAAQKAQDIAVEITKAKMVDTSTTTTSPTP